MFKCQNTMKFPIVLVFGAVLALGCGPKKNVKTAGSADDAAAAQDGQGLGADIDESDVSLDPRGKEWVKVPELEAVRFEFDRYALTPDMRTILARNAEAIKTNAAWEILVEGHTDGRGTLQYNMALGEKRAAEVRNYYRQLGIAAQRIATLTYGEDRPECEEETLECWAKNRRAATLVSAASSAKKSEE